MTQRPAWLPGSRCFNECTDRVDNLRHITGSDVEMSNEPQGSGCAHEDSPLGQCVAELGVVAIVDREVHHVRLRCGVVDVDLLDFAKACSEFRGVGVVISQALDVVFEGVETCCRQDSGLAHSTAKNLAPTMGNRDELVTAA